jgi:hypothetical protein
MATSTIPSGRILFISSSGIEGRFRFWKRHISGFTMQRFVHGKFAKLAKFANERLGCNA